MQLTWKTQKGPLISFKKKNTKQNLSRAVVGVSWHDHFIAHMYKIIGNLKKNLKIQLGGSGGTHL